MVGKHCNLCAEEIKARIRGRVFDVAAKDAKEREKKREEGKKGRREKWKYVAFLRFSGSALLFSSRLFASFAAKNQCGYITGKDAAAFSMLALPGLHRQRKAFDLFGQHIGLGSQFVGGLG
jgi:hypothetical protein